MPLLLILPLLIPTMTFGQSGSSTEIGNATFYNFDKFSVSRQSIGKTDFYNFSEESNTTRNSVGSTDFYSDSTPKLSGTTNSFVCTW